MKRLKALNLRSNRSGTFKRSPKDSPTVSVRVVALGRIDRSLKESLIELAFLGQATGFAQPKTLEKIVHVADLHESDVGCENLGKQN